jgi:hypothetical protein
VTEDREVIAARGRRAQELLDDELLKAAFEELEASYVRMWRTTSVDNVTGREKLFSPSTWSARSAITSPAWRQTASYPRPNSRPWPTSPSAGSCSAFSKIFLKRDSATMRVDETRPQRCWPDRVR